MKRMLLQKRWLWLALALVLLTGLGSAAFWYAEDLLLPDPLEEADRKGEPLSLIPSGTIVKDQPPDNWTHLLIKSKPKVHSGAIDKLFDFEKDYVSYFFLATLVRVDNKGTSARPNHVLDAIALGVGTTVHGQEIILTPDTQADLKANLSLPARLVLKGMCNKQKEARYVFHGTTFALFDTPSVMKRPRGNAEVVLRYALLIDRKTGHLDCLVWGIDPTETQAPSFGPIQWLAQNSVQTVPIYVDPHEFGPLGRPGPNAFAAEGLPQGQAEIPIPADLAPLLARDNYSLSEASTLRDQFLRLIVKTTPNRSKP